jgi:hypothetical protein
VRAGDVDADVDVVDAESIDDDGEDNYDEESNVMGNKRLSSSLRSMNSNSIIIRRRFNTHTEKPNTNESVIVSPRHNARCSVKITNMNGGGGEDEDEDEDGNGNGGKGSGIAQLVGLKDRKSGDDLRNDRLEVTSAELEVSFVPLYLSERRMVMNRS